MSHVTERDGHELSLQKEKEKEEEEEKEKKTKETFSSELDQPVSEPPVLVFACVGNGPKEFPVFQTDIDKWAEPFPGIDVKQELRRATTWLEANPSNRKTFRGMPRFLVEWLGRAQDRAKGATSPAKATCSAEDFGAFDRSVPPVNAKAIDVLHRADAVRAASVGGKE
jgi:hypothetical protein